MAACKPLTLSRASFYCRFRSLDSLGLSPTFKTIEYGRQKREVFEILRSEGFEDMASREI